MNIETHKYYHLYNRTNNREKLFKEEENYLYFLRKFRQRFHNNVTVLSYCLMTTHFHFLIRIDTHNTDFLKDQIGIFLSAYAKAINNRYDRNGSLFQKHTKAVNIDDDSYLITLLTYIHQNPLRAGLVKTLEDWPYSSYPDLTGRRNGTLVNKNLVSNYFSSVEEFKRFSHQTLEKVKRKYWINK